jgi:nucleotide-binding universal stress UspA family protein
MTAENQVKKYNNVVLIPTDFTEVCNNAVSHGVKLAKFLGYNVCILHVINKETKAVLKKKNVGPEYINLRLRDIKKYYSKKYDLEIFTQAIEGSIFSTINDVAREIGANLMVMGTHGKKGLQHVFGSYAMKVIVDSPVPVVVVQRKAFSEGYKNIVFPVSNDLEPRQAVSWAKLMAKLFNAQVHIFQLPEKDSGLKTRLNIITSQITEVFDSEKISYKISTAEKERSFAEEVISYGVLNQADLVMIMTRPNIDVPGFSLSGWSEKLIFNDAQIPVMGINPVEIGFHYYDWSVRA